MKTKLAVIVLALTLAGSAFGQTPSNMHCSKPNKWTTICTFDDGTVNETSSFEDGTYYSDWYTSQEWTQHCNHKKTVDAANMTKEQKIDRENAAIVATAKLCKKGDFNKGYCSAFATKHNLEKAGWDCLLMDGDFRNIACHYPVVNF